MTAFVLVIVAAVFAMAGWLVFEALPAARHWRRLAAVALTIVAVAAVIATLFGSSVAGNQRTLQGLFAVILAVCGGSIVTTAVFEHIDAGDANTADADASGADSGVGNAAQYSMEAAGQVLRGGAWIGVLERLAIFATVAAGWPQGIAIVLAIKALGRYPELRAPAGLITTGGSPTTTGTVAQHRPTGATERFIIGTMVSVLLAGMSVFLAVGL